MAIRQPPSNIKDPNLRGFLQELRNAIGGVGDQVNKLTRSVSTITNGGGGGGGGTDPGGGGGGGTDPGNPPPPIPTVTTIILTISPAKPQAEESFTLTATVTGDQPTGKVNFKQDGNLMTLDPLELTSGVATITSQLAKGTYTFVAEFLGDPKNYPATSNEITVEIGSVWDGPPPAATSLDASTDDPFQIYLNWTNPYIGDYAVTEIWGAKQNPPSPTVDPTDADISDIAVKLGEIASTSWVFTDVSGVALDSNENWYFWIRNRDTEGLVSEWYPAGAGVNGKTGTQPGKYLDILTGQITETQLYQDLGDKIDLIVPLNNTVTGHTSQITTLQNADVQLAQQISLVSAGATGFDVKNIWYFGQSSEITGWTSNQLTGFAVSAGHLVVNAATGATAPWFETATLTSGGAYKTFLGAEYSDVHLRLKRTAGAGWLGRLTFTISSGSTYTMDIDEPLYDADGYGTADWELSANTNWTGNTITKLRIQLGAGAGDNFEIDWMAVGRYAPGASAAQVADLASAQIGYCVISGSPSGHESKATCEAAGGTWYGNLALAQAVKQVSVTDGVSTGTIEQKFTAQKTVTDDLRLQYTVKIDNEGYVSGFGLASEPVSGIPYSDFMVRADRFSISNPTIPTWQKSVSSLTHNGTVATVTTSAAHGYSIGQYVMLANIADKYWNRTFKITAAPTTTTFQFAVSNTEPLSLNTAAASPAAAVSGKEIYCSRVIIPFIVTTTPTTENGVTIDPGVYIDTANIKKATITEALIRDAAITNAKISNLIKTSNFPDSGLPSTPFAGWRLDKNGDITCYGSFALYDSATGEAIIQGGKISFNQFKRLIVTASAELFSVAKPPATTITPTSITLTATAQNLGTPSIAWSVTSGTYGAAIANGLTATINPAQMTTATVTFKATTTVDSVVYEDYVTLAKVNEGTDALFLYISNENDSLPADSGGNLTGATSTVTSVKVYRGNTDVTISESWAITAPDASGCTASVGGTSTKSVTLSSLIADRATVTVTATKGTDILTRVMTVTKQKQGVSGGNGLNSTTVFIYQRAATTPALPSVTTTYDFTAKTLTGLNNSWTTTVPAGTNPLYVSAATASSATSTDTIASNEWAAATILSQNGSNGTNGTNGTNGIDGLNAATVYIYQRAATTPALPSVTTTYTFSTKTLTGLNNSWQTTIPAGTNPIYVSTATAVANTATDTILSTEWAAVTILAQNGANGATGPTGARGPGFYYGTGTWTDAYANSLCPGGVPIINDVVTISADSRVWTGSAWSTFSNRFNGGMFVSGGINVDRLNTASAWASQITLATGTGNYIQSQNFSANTSGFRIDGSGNAEFYNVKVRGDVLLGGGNLIPNSDLSITGSGFAGLYCVGFSNGLTVVRGGAGTSEAYPYYVTSSGSIGGHLYWVSQASTAGTVTNTDINAATNGRIRVTPGAWYQLSGYCASYLSNGDLGVHQYGISGNFLRYTSAGLVYSGDNLTGGGTLTATFKLIRGQFQVPADCFYVTPYFYKDSVTAGSYIRCTRLSLVEVPRSYNYTIPWSPGGLSLLDTLAMRQNSVTQPRYAGSNGVASVGTNPTTVTNALVLPAQGDTTQRGQYLLQGFVAFYGNAAFTGKVAVNLNGTGWAGSAGSAVNITNTATYYGVSISVPFDAASSTFINSSNSFTLTASTSTGTATISNACLYLLEAKR